MNDICLVRRLVAEVLAAAVLELFPGALLVKGEGTSLCFYYDFIFPFAPSKEIFPMLEERMRQMIGHKPALKILEMVPSNAAAYLKQNKQPVVAELAEASAGGLVSLIQIGSFIDLCHCEMLTEFPKRVYLKMLEILPQEGKVVRLLGTAFLEEPELKKFVKSKDVFQKKNHIQLGKELGLFVSSTKLDEGSWLWLPKGEMLRERLLTVWRTECTKQNFHFLSTPNTGNEQDLLEAHIECFKKCSFPLPARFSECSYLYSSTEKGFLEGMFESNGCLKETSFLVCEEKQLLEESISYLQLMIKISKILGFECKCVIVGSSPQGSKKAWEKRLKVLTQVLKTCECGEFSEETGSDFSGPAIELRVPDVLGKEWTVSRLVLDTAFASKYRLKECLLMGSLCVSFERVAALLVEKEQGI
jgi:threonyl-tRNA synthetase